MVTLIPLLHNWMKKLVVGHGRFEGNLKNELLSLNDKTEADTTHVGMRLIGPHALFCQNILCVIDFVEAQLESVFREH